MFVFVFLTMTAGIHHDENKNQEAYSEEHDDPGPAFPYLLNSRGKLGPIHVVARYTANLEK